jgi:hypothetical protein
MKPIRLRRILSLLVLGVLLASASASAAPPTTWSFVSQLWRWATHWGGIKNGPDIDPSGAPSPQGENGGSIDPSGAPTTSPKNGPGIDPGGSPASQPQNGPTIDPNGACLSGSPGCGS